MFLFPLVYNSLFNTHGEYKINLLVFVHFLRYIFHCLLNYHTHEFCRRLAFFKNKYYQFFIVKPLNNDEEYQWIFLVCLHFLEVYSFIVFKLPDSQIRIGRELLKNMFIQFLFSWSYNFLITTQNIRNFFLVCIHFWEVYTFIEFESSISRLRIGW